MEYVMLLLLLVLSVSAFVPAAATAAAVGVRADGAGAQSVLVNYHEARGIAQATIIRLREVGGDFDGGRIAGGISVPAGAQPHLGGLVIALQSGLQSVCGSSLLTNTRSVTAAHCWWDGRNQARQFTVVWGSNRLFTGGVRVDTNAVAMHAGYSPSNLINDVAIISHAWVTYTNVIRPILLPSGSLLNNQFAGWWAIAAGFGATGDNVAITWNQDKRQASLQVITNAVCQRTFGSVIVASTLCTSGAGGVSTCGGDSGGPLAVTTGGHAYLIGITSFGAAAGCQHNFPVGFARVTSFASWIAARL